MVRRFYLFHTTQTALAVGCTANKLPFSSVVFLCCLALSLSVLSFGSFATTEPETPNVLTNENNKT